MYRDILPSLCIMAKWQLTWSQSTKQLLYFQIPTKFSHSKHISLPWLFLSIVGQIDRRRVISDKSENNDGKRWPRTERKEMLLSVYTNKWQFYNLRPSDNDLIIIIKIEIVNSPTKAKGRGEHIYMWNLVVVAWTLLLWCVMMKPFSHSLLSFSFHFSLLVTAADGVLLHRLAICGSCWL